MTDDSEEELMQCPQCPDGYVWTINGPTVKMCPACKGYAVVKLSGAPCDEAMKGAA